MVLTDASLGDAILLGSFLDVVTPIILYIYNVKAVGDGSHYWLILLQ